MERPNEFSRTIKLDMVGSGGASHTISADAAERAALCIRFDLLALGALSATITLSKNLRGIRANGILQAHVIQACTVTGEPVDNQLTETMDLLFVEAPLENGEAELDEEECESMFHDGKIVDIGEAVAQTMGLAINPYPRGKNAENRLRAAGVKTEEEQLAASGPFAGLAAMNPKQ